MDEAPAGPRRPMSSSALRCASSSSSSPFSPPCPSRHRPGGRRHRGICRVGDVRRSRRACCSRARPIRSACRPGQHIGRRLPQRRPPSGRSPACILGELNIRLQIAGRHRRRPASAPSSEGLPIRILHDRRGPVRCRRRDRRRRGVGRGRGGPLRRTRLRTTARSARAERRSAPGVAAGGCSTSRPYANYSPISRREARLLRRVESRRSS